MLAKIIPGARAVFSSFDSQAFRSTIESLESRQLLAPLTFTAGPNLPVARDHAVAIVDPSQAIFIVNGNTSAVQRKYAGGTSWASAPGADLTRGSAGAGITGGTIYLFGGYSGEVLEEALRYDPVAGDSLDIDVLQTPRQQLASAGDSSGVYAIGGLGGSNQVLGSVERYRTSTAAWEYVAPLPQARFNFAGLADGAGHILVFGGASVNNSTSVTNTVFRYDESTNTWTTLSPMPISVRDEAVAPGFNGRIYVIGGATAAGATATIQSYDPATDSWTLEASLPYPIRAEAAALDSDGRIEAIGGVNSAGQSLASTLITQRLNQPDVPPSFTSSPIIKGSADKPYSYQVTATGNPNPTYSLVQFPAGMTIDPGTGLINWQSTPAQVGDNPVVVRATNFAGSLDQSFSVHIVLETVAPSIPTNVHVSGVTTNTVSLAWDPSTDNTAVAGYRVYKRNRAGYKQTHITYTLMGTTTSTGLTVSGLSAGTAYAFVVAAFDTSGNQSGYSATASATTYSLPNLFVPASLTATALHPLSFNLTATGNPKPTFSLVSGPSDMTVDPITGLVKWTPSLSDIGSVPVTFRATNLVGNKDIVTSITIRPDLPTLSYTKSPFNATAGQPFSIQVIDSSFTPSTFSIVTGPANMSIDPGTGLATWTPTPADAGNTSVTFRATNSAGSSDITVNFYTYFTGKPSNVLASNINATGATVSWDPPADASLVASYKLTLSWRIRYGRGYTSRSLTYIVNAPQTSVTVSGLTTGLTYRPTVTPLDAAGNLGDSISGTSFIARTVVIPPPEPPQPPPAPELPPQPASITSAKNSQTLSPLSSAPQPGWNISFDDPDGTWSAYYADITRVLQAAGAEWGSIFDSDASIEISVRFDPDLATSFGRSLTSAFLEHDADGFDIYEQGAAAEINTGLDPNGATPDVEIAIGVNYLVDSLWFDPDPSARTAAIPAARIDAMSVMLHDLGQALAYNGWSDWSTGQLPGTYASTFDQYIYEDGQSSYFSGANAHDVYSSDLPMGNGNVFHWGSPPAGVDMGAQLMNSLALNPQQRYDISDLDVAVMKDIGMSIESAPPVVIEKRFNFETGQSISVRFDKSVRAHLDLSDFTLVRVNPGPVWTAPSSQLNFSYDRVTDTATITFGGLPGAILPDGDYQLTINSLGVTDLVGNAMSNDLTLNFFVLKGDLNRDGTVSISDFITLSSNFNKPNATYADGDLNYDGQVTISDFIDLSANFNKSLPPPPAAPAPQPAASLAITSPSTNTINSRTRPTHPARHHHRPPHKKPTFQTSPPSLFPRPSAPRPV